MKKNSTPLVDEHLESLFSMQETGTDDFFYTRLKARMEKNHGQQGWNFPLKPVWVVSILFVFLVANGFMLTQQFKAKQSAGTTASTLQNFAASYDQTISSSY